MATMTTEMQATRVVAMVAMMATMASVTETEIRAMVKALVTAQAKMGSALRSMTVLEALARWERRSRR